MNRPSSRRLAFALGATLLLGAMTQARASLVNGGFETGTLSGWTTFTTTNGTIGSPSVVSFNTTGNGATRAAQFQVGESTYDGSQQGGGLFQSIFVSTAGIYGLSLDIAAQRTTSISNGSAGVFSLLLDGVTIDSYDFGPISANTTLRSSLGASEALAVGSHEFRILITRPFTLPGDLNQYVDDASFELIKPTSTVPEPSTLLLAGIALGGAYVGRRQRRTRS